MGRGPRALCPVFRSLNPPCHRFLALFSPSPSVPRFLRAGVASSSFRGAIPNPIFSSAAGEVAEWPKAAVLKTVDPQGSGGSNPSLSANKTIKTITYVNRTTDMKSLDDAPRRSLRPSRPPPSLSRLLPAPDRRRRILLLPASPLGAEATKAPPPGQAVTTTSMNVAIAVAVAGACWRYTPPPLTGPRTIAVVEQTAFRPRGVVREVARNRPP